MSTIRKLHLPLAAAAVVSLAMGCSSGPSADELAHLKTVQDEVASLQKEVAAKQFEKATLQQQLSSKQQELAQATQDRDATQENLKSLKQP